MITVRVLLDGLEREVACNHLVLAAFSSRSETTRQTHVRELMAHGIAPPDQVPTCFAVRPELLTTSEEIWVGDNTSGEVEFVLLEVAGEILVGVGSDHTDRVLESVDIRSSKEACPKVLSREVWRFHEVRDHWDSLVLRSWVGESETLSPYQEASVEALMTPQDLIHLVTQSDGQGCGHTVLFSGTIPTLTGGLRFAPKFRAELEDPLLKKSLYLSYTVRLQATGFENSRF